MLKTLSLLINNEQRISNACCIALASFLLATSAIADSGGADWNTSYSFPGSARHQTNMSQADLIAKRESGYYDGLGKSTVNNITSSTVGTMTTMNTTVTGNSNNVAADSLSSGSDLAPGIRTP
jgi:hypothetical protein